MRLNHYSQKERTKDALSIWHYAHLDQFCLHWVMIRLSKHGNSRLLRGYSNAILRHTFTRILSRYHLILLASNALSDSEKGRETKYINSKFIFARKVWDLVANTVVDFFLEINWFISLKFFFLLEDELKMAFSDNNLKYCNAVCYSEWGNILAACNNLLYMPCIVCSKLPSF